MMAPRYAISNSDSESEAEQPSHPSDYALEKALRDIVGSIYKSGKVEELTVKRVRLAAEKALKLEEGFFKSTGNWKTRSDQIIKDEVDVQDTATQGSQLDADKEEKDDSPPRSKFAKRGKTKAASVSRKRRKTSPSESEDIDAPSEFEEGISEDEVPKSTKKQPKATQKGKPLSKASKKQEEVVDDSDSDAKGEETISPEGQVDQGSGSESEMSVVLDEEPKPKRQRQKSTATASKKATKKTAEKGKDADSDPNQVEIKRLQGWLIKCGIRKMWYRELAPYDTPKAKIKHLKEMLVEAGMQGRYSVEKAKQIREERELKADLELVQEGAKRWGAGGADEDSDDGQARRRLNRGRQSLAFLESDGEESD